MSTPLFLRHGLASLLFGASLLSLPAVAQRDGTPVTIFGVSPAPMGTASLTVETGAQGSKTLKVSNLGSSGLDGVRIALGSEGANSVLLAFDEITPTAGNDATVIAEVFGTVNGGPVQNLVTYTSQSSTDPIEGVSWHTTADFSPLGSQTATLTGHDFGLQAFSYPALTSDIGVGTKASNAIIYFTADDGTRICSMGPSHPVVVKPAIAGGGGGGGPGAGTEAAATVFDFAPEGFLGTCDAVTSVEVRFMDTEDVTLTGFSSKIAGTFATGVDEAQVSASAGKIKVSNLGSSGCDGVSIDAGGPDVLGMFAQAASFDVDLRSSGAPIGPGAIFSANVDVRIAGVYDLDFMAIQAECFGVGIPDVVQFDCSSSTLPFVWEFEATLAGLPVVSGDPATTPLAVDRFFDLLTDAAYETDASGAKALRVSFAQPTSLFVNAVPHTIDSLALVVSAANAWRVTALEAIAVQTQGITEFTIGPPTASNTPYTNLSNLKSNGHVTVLKGPLSGGGTLEGQGSLGALMLRDAPPSASTLLFIGLGANPLPFKGGFLVPLPSLLQLSLPTDGQGAIDLPFAWPAGIPTGFELVFQYAAQDNASPESVWLSNALKLSTP